MDIYRGLIIELCRNPLNKRAIPDADITSSGANVTCGDRVRMYAKAYAGQPNPSDMKKAGLGVRWNGNVTDCSFEGEGCAISIAAASLLTEEAQGKKTSEILGWGAEEMFKLLDVKLGPSRVKCGLLPLETLQEGILRFTRAKE